MAEVEVLRDAAVLVRDQHVAWVGNRTDARDAAQRLGLDAGTVTEVEVRGVMVPGFVDCHTHAVFAAPRLEDHERRALGETYQAIAAAGGGILQSVRQVRECSEDELYRRSLPRVAALIAHGSTTIEIKSGYGLDLEAERKQLRVIRRLSQALPVTIVPTFLGAHEVPPEYRTRRAEYVRLLCEDMLPEIARDALARRCDVFCEPGVFTPPEARRILEAARALGLEVMLHADELETSGGAELAAALGARSADHLAAISDHGIRALAVSETMAVLLPATMTFLGRRAQAPARRMIEAGVGVALATDFNPGSSPTTGLPLVMSLGVSQLGLRHAEALIAVTVNAAAALGLAASHGQIAPGFRADFAVAAVEDWRELAYWLGGNRVTAVWTGGSACRPPTGSLSLGSHVEARETPGAGQADRGARPQGRH